MAYLRNRLRSSGPLGINIPKPTSRLHVVETAGDKWIAQFINGASSSGDGIRADAGNTSDHDIFSGRNFEGTVKFEVHADGSGLLVGSWSSDERLKENIKDTTYGLAEVLQLKPVEFTWLDQPQTLIKHGFIAQDAELIMPKMIQGDSSEEADANMSFDYFGMTAVLTKAIQELSAKNDALEAKVTALENA